MLPIEEVNLNKIRFLSILNTLKEDASNDIDGLEDYLEKEEFFDAPASTKYVGSYRGGLCEQSLNIYDTFTELCAKYSSKTSAHTLIKLGLLSNVYKATYYETFTRNVKNAEGQWEQVQDIRIADSKTRNTYGTNAFNSYMILSRFLTFTDEEIVTLINHNCGMDDNWSNKDLSAILGKYPLTVLLHCASMIATYTKNE